MLPLLEVLADGKDYPLRPVTTALADRFRLNEVELKESRGNDYTKPFVFPAFNRTLEDGKLYTLDPCPNDWYGYWSAQVVNGLCDSQPSVAGALSSL